MSVIACVWAKVCSVVKFILKYFLKGLFGSRSCDKHGEKKGD